ncbi:hypothetical protein K8I85_07280 [bacterium]|nr:hypothetical protein [bacterium]
MNRARRFVLPAALASAVFACGCADSEKLVEVTPEPLPRDFTDPAALVRAHGESLEAMDFDRYAALLAADFEFVPQAEDFPWIPNDTWGRTAELGMVGNMMDPGFVGGITRDAVDAIAASLHVANRRDVADGVEVTCNALIQVLWAAESGAWSDVRLVFLLVPDGDGFLRIRTITEFAPLSAVVPETWGHIKSLFRSELPPSEEDPA